MISGIQILATTFQWMGWLAEQGVTSAPTTGPGTGTQDPPWWAKFGQNPLFLILIMVAVMYFFVIRSKQKQEKQRRAMLDDLKRGDRVQTIGGILGTVVEAKESEVVVKVDEASNTKMRFVRSAIHKVTEEEKGK